MNTVEVSDVWADLAGAFEAADEVLEAAIVLHVVDRDVNGLTAGS